MTIAFVLGNGTSRQHISLPALAKQGKIYGCNGLHRDYIPDVLVATDRPIATAIQESGYAQTHEFYTRKPIAGLGALCVPTAYYGYSSGPIATAIAAQQGHTRVYLVGFDMGPTSEKKINNLYAGTEFYRSTDAPPTFTGNWIKQLCKIAQDYKNVKFIRIVGANTADIKELQAINNFQHLDISTFIDRINNKKDL
jgi:hypothetical protein